MTTLETIETLRLQFGPMGDIESVSNEPIVYHTPWVKRVDHLALIAAAFEVAAQKIKPQEEVSYHIDLRVIRQQYASAIRALTPPDAQAALQAMIDAAVKEALDGCISDAEKVVAFYLVGINTAVNPTQEHVDRDRHTEANDVLNLLRARANGG